MKLQLVAALGLLSLLLTGCDKPRTKPANGLATQRVRLQTVERKPHVASEEVPGTVRAKLHAAIEPKVSSRIEAVLVVPGQPVQKGELLVQLDAREIQARLDQAVAVREQAARDADRLRRLLADQTVSRQEFEAVESRHRVAVAAATEAETMMGYTRITAPFSGVVTRKLADVGDFALPGRPLLEIDDPAALRLEADVPESLIHRIEPGSKLEVTVGAAEKPIGGVVTEIAPVADSASRTFNVKLDLPPATQLRAGQFARLKVPLEEQSVLRVPASAVVQRGQMEIVFVASAERAQLRLVKSGKRIDGEVEIVSGVTPGEQVVIEGASQLRDGQPIELIP